MRFGGRVSKTPCQNRNPWVQGLARCFAYTCTKSHPNRSKFGGDIVQIGAHQFSLSAINFVINSTPQGLWERKDQKTRVTPYRPHMSASNLSDLGDHVDPKWLEELWRHTKAVTAFYWARGRHYPSQLGQLTVNHARKMIEELSQLDTPPTTLGEFMPPHKIIGKVDDLLYQRLEACLPNISPFLDELPSRESGPQSCLEAPRGAGKVSLEPSEEAVEGVPDLEVPRGTGSEGPLESSREAVRIRFIGEEAPTPTIVLTPVITR